MASARESSLFMTYFCNEYKERYGKAYRLNRNTAKWAARDIIDSFGYDDCVVALGWALYVKEEPFTWEWFTNNTEKLLKARNTHIEDMSVRANRRQRAKEWLNS